MAANLSPIFGKTPIAATGTVSVANGNRDGTTGTYATIYTAGASGAYLNKIIIKATVTTTAGLIRLFLDNKLIWEEPISAIVASATQFAWEGEIGRKITMKPNQVLTANTEKAETFHITAMGYDYE
jgi:hypothetical protein